MKNNSKTCFETSSEVRSNLAGHQILWLPSRPYVLLPTGSEEREVFGLGICQYNSLGEYCGPHTASYVFLILIVYGGGGADQI